MSSALNVKRATVIIGGISAAIVCASAALYWYRRRRRSGGRKGKSQKRQKVRRLSSLTAKPLAAKPEETVEFDEGSVNDSTIGSSSSASEIEMTTTMASYPTRESGRGGRRDYRHHRRNLDDAPVQINGCYMVEHESATATGKPTSTQNIAATSGSRNHGQTTGNIFNDPAIVEAATPLRNGFNKESDYACYNAEMRGAKLAGEFEAKCQVSAAAIICSSEQEVSPETLHCDDCDSSMQQTTLQNGIGHDSPSPLSSIKGQCVESPSLSSDLRSEGSQDSGKGTSTGLLSSTSPVEDFIEIPAVYEFEVPQDIVGLLIGKQGTTIKWLTQQSQAHIVIRQHFYSDRHKICTLEGTREQINKCLRYIRRKFPPSRFPDLKLTPIIPPPVTASHTPVWDNVIQLNLPEGVNCEVVVSSIVTAGHFFVQQPTHPTFPSLARLDQYMAAVYSQPIAVPPLPRPVDAGVICAAPVLGGWYRAQTMDVYEDMDEVLVKFVDYGGYSRVPAADLRQIRSDFMTLPFQATECYLAHAKPTPEKGNWSREESAAFEQFSQGKVLEASVTGHAKDGVPLVDLYVPTQDSKAVTITRLLIANGHAIWAD